MLGVSGGGCCSIKGPLVEGRHSGPVVVLSARFPFSCTSVPVWTIFQSASCGVLATIAAESHA